MATTDTLPATHKTAWDPLVRITHWGVATAVLLNGIATEEGGQIHVWIGYAAFALLLLRVIWGLVGPTEARFSAFPPSLSAAWAHIGEIRSGIRASHRSHNPLGALMVYALWGSLAIVCVTGVSMAGSPFKARPSDGGAAVMLDHGTTRPAVGIGAQGTREQVAQNHDDDDDDDYGDREHPGGKGEDSVLEEIHGAFANLMLVLAAFHVAGVAFETRRTGPGILRAMTFGKGARSGG